MHKRHTHLEDNVFWYPKWTNSGKDCDLKVSINTLTKWLMDQGFNRYRMRGTEKKSKNTIVRYKDGILYTFNLETIVDWIVGHFIHCDDKDFEVGGKYCVPLSDSPDDGYFTKDDLLERLAINNFFNKHHYSYFGYFDDTNPKLFTDEQYAVYLKFNNKVVKVMKDKIEELDWSDILKDNMSVWDTEKLNHEIEVNYNFKDGDGGLFEKFVKKCVSVDNELNNPNWKDNYELVPERYEEIKLTYGYMISNYKSEDNAKIVIFIDEHSDGITKNGGTGKSIISESIKYFKCYKEKDGRRKRSFESQFLFSDIDYDTKFVNIQDAFQGFSLENIYNMITGTLEVEPKYKDVIYVPFEYSPKFSVNTNFLDINFKNFSDERRRQIIEVGNFWKVGSELYGETPSCKGQLGKKLFGQTFTDDDWNEFYNFGIHCIQVYLNEGKLIKHQEGHLPTKQNNNHLRMKVLRMEVEGALETGECQWISDWLEDDRVYVGADVVPGIKLNDLYSEFIQDFSHLVASEGMENYKKKFRKMIYTVSESLGYEVNGHNRHKGKTPTKRRHLLPNPITGGNDEYLTITQITPNPPPVKGSQQGSVNTQFTEDPLIKVSGSMDSGDLDTIERSDRDVQDKKNEKVNQIFKDMFTGNNDKMENK